MRLGSPRAALRATAKVGQGAVGLIVLPRRVATVALGTVVRLDGALRNLDELAGGVRAMHDEMVGLRTDVQGLGAGVAGLRTDVRKMDSGVAGIRLATESLDGRLVDVVGTMGSVDARLGALSASLEAVDLLAARLGRLTGRRARVRDAGVVVEEPAREAAGTGPG